MEFDQLIKHLSPACRQLFEQSIATASSRSHFQLDVEHLLDQAMQQQESEFKTIFIHFGLTLERLLAGLQLTLDGLKTGNSGFPRIGSDVARLLFESWMLASSQFQSLQIQPAHLLLAMLENDLLRMRLTKISAEFGKLHAADLRDQCASLLQGKGIPADAAPTSGGPTSTPALNQFTIDLTAQARSGKIDPVLGRDNEIRQMVDILCRRRQNNPILTGEAGVGKTAVVEGLAQRIVDGDVPTHLRDVSLRTLDMGLLQAGAGVKGEFENRLKNVIKEVQQSPQPIILFIDEAHTLIGAGNQSGAGDAANLLKPALARGELRTIAATTWAEYKKYFESDAALTRRFQVVKVDEPDEAHAIVMLRSLAAALERHHRVIILEEAVVAAVQLSHRYIAGRQLPDKCVSLLDTACARVNLSRHTMPPALERCDRELASIEAATKRLQSEQRAGADHEKALVDFGVKHAALQAERSALEERWQATRDTIAEVANLRRTLERPETQTDSPVRASLQQALLSLKQLQGDSPLLFECVDMQVVAEVVADWTGIPVGRMQIDDIRSVLGLRDHLEERVVGQSHALDLIAKTMQTARAKLGDPRRPLGVFLLAGPSGVGKTETALALAEQLYGSERSITVINMSEFKEEHKVSLLMGSPPGYVGYGEGGILTEAVRRKPYSVVLLDEIEKAHPGVQDIFYQVFDKGMLRDGEGRDIDFKNTVIILTSNAASEQIEKLCSDQDTRPTAGGLVAAINPTLRQTFKPALLGRLNVIPYFPLDQSTLAIVARMQLQNIQQRVERNYGANLICSETFIAHIVDQCQQSDTGARQISAILNNTLLPMLAEQMLLSLAKGSTPRAIDVDIIDGEFNIKLDQASVKAKGKRGRQKAKA